MLLVLPTGIRGGLLFVPLFVGASVGLATARRGAATHTAVAAGVGAALLGIALAAGLAFVALVFLFGNASTTQPGLGDRVLALLVAAAGVAVAVRSVWPAVGVAMVAVACLVLVPPLGRPIEVHAAHGLAAPDYPPTPRDDPRRGLPLTGGTVSLTKSKIFYINGEGGDPTHRLIARWRPPLGLVPEQTPITDLCGPVGQPCPRWFLDDPKRSVAPADEPQLGLALEPDGRDRVRVRAAVEQGAPVAWSIGVGPWQWWRGLVWLALLAVGGAVIWRSRSR